MNIDKQLREALILRYQGEIAAAKANIAVYMKQSVGIGEHSDVTEAVMAELDKLSAAHDRLEMINIYFPTVKQKETLFE